LVCRQAGKQAGGKLGKLTADRRESERASKRPIEWMRACDGSQVCG
jgi:hypothetical protein